MNVRVRAPTPDDIPALTDLINQPEVQANTARIPYTQATWVSDRVTGKGDAVHPVVAVLDGQTVGWATLVRGDGRRAHTGDLGISVSARHWGSGVGTALLGALLDLADGWLGLRRIELEVAVPNDRAQRLYTRHGFEVEVRRTAAILTQGTLLDTLVMARLRPPPASRP